MPDRTSSSGSSSAAAVAELQQVLLAAEHIADFLVRLTVLAVEALPGGVSCGITLRRDHGAATVASSDSRASQVDEVQYRHDEGPCLRSLATGQVVVVDDLADDDRWGGYRLPALGHGISSSLSLPLRVRDAVLGTLNIYATRPRAFGPAEQLTARRLAEEASRALDLALRVGERNGMSGHLQDALESRAVIDQARGIIMGQHRCTADEALEVLLSSAQNRGVELRAVAGETVGSVGVQAPVDGLRSA